MRKGLEIVGILFILLIVVLCGCSEQKTVTEQELKINHFTVTPNYIKLGETANLSWETTGADTVSIDNGIGDVGLQGKLIISPIGDTIYHLYASIGTHNISAVVSIIVEGGTDIDYTTPETPTLAWSVDAASDKIIITKCTPSDTTYASAADAANLKFTNGTVDSFVLATTLAITLTESGLETGTIDAGHEITGFTDGTQYTVVWIPSNQVLGSFAV